MSTTSDTPISEPSSHPRRAPGRSRWVIPVIVGSLAILGVVAYLMVTPRSSVAGASGHDGASPRGGETDRVTVDVVRPIKGGMERVSTMTGTIRPFESANLYANVSGYLKTQELTVDGSTIPVDIGVHVKKGDVLAVIDVPEVYAAQEQAQADVEQAEAGVKQSEAMVETAKADLAANEAGVREAEANVGRFTAGREEAGKAYNRYERLRAQSAVEQDVVDQRQDAYESAVASEKSSQAAVLTAKAKVIAGKAKVDQAIADKKASEANLGVARAKKKKADVLVGYTRIHSPYTGVVTARNYFPGDFIRSASDGNTQPLLNVARTDLMRVVTKIADTDVPYVDTSDPAEITIQAIPGEVFHAKVARFTESENPSERTMLTEVDLPNDPKSQARGRLREGMYGEARIVLTPPSGHLTIPSSCLVGPAKGHQNAVLVAREGKAVRVTIQTGVDDGARVEAISGLDADAQVILPNSTVSDGTPVDPVEHHAGATAH